MTKNVKTSARDLPRNLTLGDVCAELEAENWFEEPKTISTSLCDFSLKLDTNLDIWHRHQVDRLESTASGDFELGAWSGNITIVSPADVGAPPNWWDFGQPAAALPAPYCLKFAELQHTLGRTDWSDRPEFVEVDGVTSACRHWTSGSVEASCDFSNELYYAALTVHGPEADG